MDSYVESQYQNLNHHPHHQENDNQHQNSGLLRFRSAPSSLFFEYTNQLSDTHKQINNNGSLEEEEDYSESYEKKPQIINNIGYSTTNSNHELPPQYPKQSVVSTSNSMEINQSETTRGDSNNGGRLNLNRQSSSPAGFFSQLNPQNGYTVMRGLGSFRVGNGTSDEASPRASRLSISHLPGIPEIGNEIVKETSPDEVKFRHHEDDPGYDSPSGYSFTSWNDSGSDASHLSENGGLLSRGSMLTHHLSLPKTSTEMAAIEKLLHFQDAVPCKVRAKRGCATHPRSIAERVRRNRISERMRKLQDLVPNMDKQTNTADMLDLAVDYIKNLQNEFKVLSDVRAKCQCINLQ